MRDYLLFTMAAPMASFGGLAVGERRPSDNRPTKSQIIGLLASALGITRSQEGRQQALTRSLGIAVRVDDPGLSASDYHTAEAAKEPSIRRRARTHGPLATRRDELACDDRKTILSMREYRTGVLAIAVLWLRQGGPATLAEIRDGLRAPAFVLFSGRKSFPLMLPCRPEVHTAATVEAGLALYDASRSADLHRFEADWLAGRLPRPSTASVLYADADAALAGPTERIETRRDEPETRTKWRFSLRDERVLSVTPAGES